MIFWKNVELTPRNHADRFSYEVSRRVQLELLAAQAAGIPDAEIDLLTGLDRVLEGLFVPGNFVWDEELVSGFPKSPFWYLYGRVGDR